MTEFAKLLAANGISVLTYDKRRAGESDCIYTATEVSTNNISYDNLNLLAQDAGMAVTTLYEHNHSYNKNIPIGLIGFSQSG